MRKKILSLLLALGLTMSISMPTLAESLTQQLNNQKKQLIEQQSSYVKQQRDFEKLEISIEKLDANIEQIYSAIDKAKFEISDTENKIEQTQKEIVIAENNIKDEEALFNQRMRVMFINGADSYLEILLDSEGIQDLISRAENVKEIIEYDNKIISELNEKKKDIEHRKSALNYNKIKVLTLKSENENKLDKLNVKQSEQSELIVQAKKQQKLNGNEITATQALLDSTTDQIKEANKIANDLALATKKTQEVTPSRGNVTNVVKNQVVEQKVEAKVETKVETKVVKQKVSEPIKTSTVSSNEVINYAKRFLGTPYEWAATGPNTFDCSGFVQYVYAHFGVTTGRSTYDQITHGVFVSRSNLQPGDLVFFGSGSPHHVGIYVGNNSYIHAPRTGDVVKISPLTRSDYMSARRVR